MTKPKYEIFYATSIDMDTRPIMTLLVGAIDYYDGVHGRTNLGNVRVPIYGTDPEALAEAKYAVDRLAADRVRRYREAYERMHHAFNYLNGVEQRVPVELEDE